MGERRRRVVVVGGGITGLTAAYRLAQAAARDAKLSIELVESSQQLGGKIFTERSNGFLVEGGPDTFLARKPEAITLCRELGLADKLIPTNTSLHRSFVSRDGKLYQLPEGITGLVPTKLGPLFKSGLLSLAGKLRAAYEPFVPRYQGGGDTEESVADFMCRRLGTEAYDYLIEPLLCGIYAGHGERLSLAATSPNLTDMEQEHGSVLRGLRLADRASAAAIKKYPTPFISLADGLDELINALHRRLATVNVRSGTQVEAAHVNDHAFELKLSAGETISAEAIIFTTPAYVTAQLLNTINPSAAELLGQIQFVSNAAVALGYRAGDVKRPLDGYGYVVPRREGGLVLACTWASSKLPNRAPDGNVLVRIFLGRDGCEVDSGTSNDQLEQTARDEVARVLGANRDPVFVRLFRYPKAMPQYTLGHLDRIDRLDRLLAATAGVFVAGNSYRGVGISDCIRSGQQAAFETLRYLDDFAG